ncbi:MAG: TetR/AcrR family transcriptional regulator [Deltaproteobacteria bacterium]|nr:TetR/AcrR family transcriptional regulator [Deltaproteobacteria bacterium]
MARNREFNSDDIIEKAIAVFWEKGFKHTSMEYLLENLGIGRGSFYNAYKSKHALYLMALDSYSSLMLEYLRKLLNHKPIKNALRALFEKLFDAAATDNKQTGCLMANAATELASFDNEVQKRVSAYYRNCVHCISLALSRSVNEGEIALNESPDDVALFLVNAMDGLRVMARRTDDKKQVNSVIKIALSIIE